ncbi:hypothetical protein JAAARDRAFT_136960 [Jaapia argillacea MUCL 33604]|uniref:GmrSD restriction endonucleases N-terminal domain-containing protein n=1 Tax=Jaapia argillacea MUCL 33604 TaxID=933084 RepID=A0A067PQG1_9AGAM|nr:hypothetical protein JAAARDRAFT_136960 [Jaapia argillacea MUCL 33604]
MQSQAQFQPPSQSQPPASQPQYKPPSQSQYPPPSQAQHQPPSQTQYPPPSQTQYPPPNQAQYQRQSNAPSQVQPSSRHQSQPPPSQQSQPQFQTLPPQPSTSKSSTEPDLDELIDDQDDEDWYLDEPPPDPLESQLTLTHAELKKREAQGQLEKIDNPNGFEIRDPLPEPKVKRYTAKAVHTFIHEGLIDVNPPYQRDVVWPESKQTGLIDSIFRNFWIPPIVFAITNQDGEEVRVCVDGKQRLTSIQKFIDGHIPHKDVVTGKKWWFTSSDTLKKERLQIPEYHKKKFFDKIIACVEYDGISATMEREIFQRVQLGMTLTAAEKLQAIASPYATWIASLQARYITSDDGLSSVIQFDQKRGRDYHNLAGLVFLCFSLPTRESVTEAKMRKWLSKNEEPDEDFKTDVTAVLREMWEIATTKRLNQAFVKIENRVAPVEFVFIGVLLYIMRSYPSTIEDRARSIYNFRWQLRKMYRDIRANTTIARASWEYIVNAVAGTEGEILIEDVDEGKKGKGKTRASNGRGKGKRRRDSDSEDDGDDGEYGRRKSTRNRGKK